MKQNRMIRGIIARAFPTRSELLELRHYSNGFTLVEMIVAMLILSLLIMGIFRFLLFVNNSWVDGYVEQQIMANMQSVQQDMGLDIKEAALNPVPPYDCSAAVQDNGNEMYIFKNQPTKSGTVNTIGTTVTLAGGEGFNTGWAAGTAITINSVQYTIASVDSSNQLTLTSPGAPTQNGVAYSAPSNTMLEQVYYYLDNQKQELERTVIYPLANGSFSSNDPINVEGTNWTVLLQNVVEGDPYYGYVNTNGTTVTFSSGQVFSTGWPSGAITINNVQYTIASVNSPNQLTLTSPGAPTQSGVAYTHAPNSGFVNTSGTAVTLVSGQAFNTGWTAGTTITINNVQYTIASVNGPNQLTLTSPGALTQSGVAYTETDSGTVNTSGTTVTLASGEAFNTGWAAGTITLYPPVSPGGVQFVIASVTSPNQLTLTSSAGNLNGVAYAHAPIFSMNDADPDHPNLSVNVTLECSNPVRPRVPLVLYAQYAVRSNMSF